MKKLFAMILTAAMVVCLFAGVGTTAFAASDSIMIGGIGPITGPAAIYGQSVKNGAEIAFEEINALGGLQFEFNFQDDAHDAETSVKAYDNLMDWGMQALIGTVTSTPCAAVAAVANDEGIFVLTPSASSPSVLEGNSNIFQMCFSDPNQGVGVADYIAERNMSEAIGVIYNNGDAYSTGIYEKFMAEAEAKGLNIVYEGTFTDDSATDFSAQLTAAKDKGADMLFLPFYYTPISVIMSQCKAMNWDVKYFGVDGMDGILTLEGFDAALAEGAYLLTPFSADAEDELTANFVASYTEKFGETPNQFAADGYDCAYAIYNACTELGLTADMDAEEISAALIEAFASGEFTFSGVTGNDMTWSESGEVSKVPMAVIIKDGVYALNVD